MLNMTVGEFIGVIAAGVAALVAFIKGVEYLVAKAGRAATKWLEKGLAPTNAKLDSLDKKIAEVDLSQCKNFLVRFLSDVEQGARIDEVERERFYETYQHYINAGGNSYIHEKVESLKKQGKL